MPGEKGRPPFAVKYSYSGNSYFVISNHPVTLKLSDISKLLNDFTATKSGPSYKCPRITDSSAFGISVAQATARRHDGGADASLDRDLVGSKFDAPKHHTTGFERLGECFF